MCPIVNDFWGPTCTFKTNKFVFSNGQEIIRCCPSLIPPAFLTYWSQVFQCEWIQAGFDSLKKGARRPKASLGLQGFKILIKSGLKVWRGRDAMLRLDGGHTDPPDSHWSPIAHNTPLPMLRSNDERHDEQLREERDVDDDHVGPSRWPKLQWLFDEGISYFSAPTGTQHCHFTSAHQFCHNWYYYCYYLWLCSIVSCFRDVPRDQIVCFL